MFLQITRNIRVRERLVLKHIMHAGRRFAAGLTFRFSSYDVLRVRAAIEPAAFHPDRIRDPVPLCFRFCVRYAVGFGPFRISLGGRGQALQTVSRERSFTGIFSLLFTGVENTRFAVPVGDRARRFAFCRNFRGDSSSFDRIRSLASRRPLYHDNNIVSVLEFEMPHETTTKTGPARADRLRGYCTCKIETRHYFTPFVCAESGLSGQIDRIRF